MRSLLSSSRSVLLVSLTASAVIGALATPAAHAVGGSGNASLNLTKSVTSTSFVPTMSATLAVDASSAIPGDPLTYTARVTNTGATLTLRGTYSAAESTDATGTVADWYDDVEYKDPATNAWLPLGGYQASSSGWTPVVPAPAVTGLTVQTTPTPATGVTYPDTGDRVLGTVIGAGKTAGWSYVAQLTLTAAQVGALADPARSGGIRNVVHLEVTPRAAGTGQPFTFRTEFANPFSGKATPLTGASVTFTLPDGSTRTVDSSAVPGLASIPRGGSVSVPTTWSVPLIPRPGADEADAAYLSRLAAVEGTALTARATATATGAGSTVTATTNTVSTTEHLPILSVGKTGPATVDAGTTGRYSLPLANSGGAGATGIALTDTVPDGSHGTLSGVPASLGAGAGATATADYPVPDTQPDGPLTDTARVTWTDANGNPYGPVSASFTTTVQSSLVGATLTLSPASAGPDVVGTDQPLTVTLTDRNNHPVAGIAVSVAVTGTNTAGGTVTTGSAGTAVFHYSGTAAGLDTAQATATSGTVHVQSNTSTIGWVTPIAPIGTTPLDGRFFTEPSTAQTFVARPGDTPEFGQTFPNLAFNPSAAALPHNATGVGPTTHPFTDVTTDIVGNGVGTIVAQGNGKQAGAGTMTSFDAVFTATFVVAKPGDVTFRFDYDAGFLFGVGGGASRVSGSYENPPASNLSPFEGYPLVGADNRPNNAVHTTTVTVHFPAAGSYPYEVDYTESAGPTLSLVLSTVSFTQDTSGLTAYVGYADGLRPGGSIFPFPWSGSPNTVFVGCTGNCVFDAGAVRLDNTTGHAVTINSLTVDIGPNCRFAIWPADKVLPDGQSALYTQTISGASSGCPTNGSFDTSDAPFITCTPTGLIPHITFTVDGVAHTFDDTTQILNTKGVDAAGCGGGNESHAWTRVGGNGVEINTPLPPAGSVVLSPLATAGTAHVTSVQAPAGSAQSFRVDVLDASGLPVANAPVDLTIAGAHPGHVLGTTGADGTAELSYTAGSAGDDQLQASAFISGMRTVSGLLSVHWSLPAGTVPDPDNPGQTLPAPPPTITAPGPADGIRVTAPVPVTAAITPPDGETVTSWKVTYRAAAPGSPAVVLASGSGAPPATLATFDPTVLPNDTYTITVTATSSNGGLQSASTTVAVAGNLKLGRYVTTYKDVDVPVNGMRMQVLRSYDSTEARVGDFGVGWQVSVGNFRISANRTLGAGGWTEYPTTCTLFGCFWKFKSSVPHTVTVTFPDRHQEQFDFTPLGGVSVVYFFGSAAFTAVPGTGTTSTLEALDSGISYDFAGNIDSGLFGPLYAPTRFKLTTLDGRVFILDTTTGLVSETDAAGNSLSVDAAGVHASNGESITFARDGLGRITQVTDPAGQPTGYSYSAAGDLSAVHHPDGSVDGYGYDAAHNLTGVTGDGHRVSTLEYDAAGRIVAVTDGAGNRTTIDNDVAGRTQAVTSPSGRLTTIDTLDDLGDVIRQDAAGGGTTRTSTATYDAVGHLRSTTDPLHHTSSATYDANGAVTSITDGAGSTTHYTNDASGRPLSQVLPDGTPQTVLTYDSRGNVLTRRLADGSTTTYTHDPAGHILSVTDPGGRMVSYGYDAAGHLASVTDPLGNPTAVTVDANGLVTAITDPLGATTSMAYDQVGNLLSIIDPAGNVQRQSFDGLGNITSTTDGLGRTTTNTYDDASRLLAGTGSDGAAVRYTYDADGNVAGKTVSGGDTSTYTYDPFGELTAAANATATLSFGYNAAGNLVSAGSTGTAANSLPTVEHTYGYDAAGRRVSASGPEGDVAYGFDDDGRLTSVTDGGGGTFALDYDANGRLRRLHRPNGIVDTLGYTASGDLESRDAAASGQAPAGKAEYTLDGYGRRTATTDLAGSHAYTYDADGQVLSATHPAASGLGPETYSYDAAGNRSSGGSHYDAGQQLTGNDQRGYQYDAAGDVVKRTDAATGGVTTYAWDAEHLLRGATLADGSTAAYRYDPLGRRVEEVHGGQTARYGYDQDGISAEYNQANALVATYLAAPNRDAQLEVARGGQRYYPTVDGLGSITGLTDSAGTLVQRNTYDAFGNRSTTGTVLDPFGFTGKRLDPVTGWYDYGLRQYDPGTGRFASTDPLPGPSRYAYASNDPVNLTDPSGASESIEYASLEAETAALLEEGEADVTVYYTRNTAGCYFGITNNLERRELQHEAANRGFGELIEVQENLRLTRNQARVVEQRLINEGGGALSDGGKLVNKINSIAKGSPLWDVALNATISFLDVAAILSSLGCP